MRTVIGVYLLSCCLCTLGQELQVETYMGESALQLEATQDCATLSIVVEQGRLSGEYLRSDGNCVSPDGQALELALDADFGLDLFWTNWRFPGRANNGDNRVLLTRDHFDFVEYKVAGERLDLFFKGDGLPLELRVSYKLMEGVPVFQRQVSVRDLEHGGHFLDTVHGRLGSLKGHLIASGETHEGLISIEGSSELSSVNAEKKHGDQAASLLKAGGFGQPVALSWQKAGVFGGLEYPAATNHVTQTGTGFHLDMYQEIGERIGKTWTQTAWSVMGISGDGYVKKAFFDYLDRILVAPPKPYTLYNSWYDLRSVEYPKVPEAHHMTEANVLRMVETVKANIVEKGGIPLEAFVLDDGWDVYDSDWALREPQFPNGMKPISKALAPTNTDLGIWFGPTGGYSFKMRRLAWMADHNYELIQDYERTYPNSMLCLAGQKYGELFKQRVVDFVKQDQVGFFKWDGIQFSCSDASHGHGVGKFSRRATMERVIEICAAVREVNPDIYLNITSGTWLSPWWLAYSNQIWMDGQDYAFADVPSLNKRHAAMTYRDFVLYDDFENKDLWFPIAHLMTHGIIKGKLDHIGGNEEPIDTFTDNALLYFARGVSMWELYISPDILSDAEWEAIGGSIRWAREHFDILDKTVMVGGDPMQREPYGYVHYEGSRGILAIRNPIIESQSIRHQLDPAHGLYREAANLVLERVYPDRWIAPQLYSAGATIELPLGGFETAIYEIYPLEEAHGPLIAGARFQETERDGQLRLELYDGGQMRLLNPERVTTITAAGEPVYLDQLSFPLEEEPKLNATLKDGVLDLEHVVGDAEGHMQVALLFRPSEGSAMPQLSVVGGDIKVEKQDGRWGWYRFAASGDTSRVRLDSSEGALKGELEAWLIYDGKQEPVRVDVGVRGERQLRVLPPRPREAARMRRSVQIGTFELK